jgi:membrane protein required for colicin V production
MLVVYVMATVGVFLIAGLIRALVKTLKLSALDRQLGLMLGAVEGAVVGLIVTLFVVSLAPESREPIFSSPTGRVVGRLMDHVGPVMPDEARKVLAKFWDPDWKPGVRMVAQVADRTREENIAAKPDDTAGESSWGLFERDGESPARNSRPRTGRRGDSDDTNDARPRRR